MEESITVCFIFCSFLFVVTSRYCIKDGTDSFKCNYIPTDIPTGIAKVTLVEFYSKTGSTWITRSYFQSKNWGHVKHLALLDETIHDGELHLAPGCFSGLKMLVKLKILSTKYMYHDSDLFLGLDALKTLDLSDCRRQEFSSIIPTLQGSKKLPHLENLLLSNLGVSTNPSKFDYSFTHALNGKNITHLDMSRSQISIFNTTSLSKDLKHLKVLNLSYSTVGDTIHKGNLVSDLQHIDMVDASFAVAPKSWVNGPIGKIVFINYTIKNIDKRNNLKTFFSLGNINASGVLSSIHSLWIEKCRMEITKPVVWHTKGIVARYNNVKRLDLTVQCDKYKLKNFKHFDISHNGLEFMHPSILACLPNLSKLDLSYNQLFKMVEEDTYPGWFENLLQPLTHLRWISLSSNNLETISRQFFGKNVELEYIDLSGNRIRHVNFLLSHLKKINILNLQDNQLQTLNDESINILNSVHPDVLDSGSGNILLLKGNPISCSTCQTKESIKWLSMTTLLNINAQSLTCVSEAGERVNIDEMSVKMVQTICNRKTIIMSVSIAASVLAMIVCVSTFAVCKRRKHTRRMEKMATVLQKLFEGQGQFEFVAFLSFSSDDKDFIDTYVYTQLNDNLKIMTGTDRNLVCVGDEYLRPGFLVLDETVRCIERASVMIAVVSNTYCDSPFCHNELDQAYRLNKPIILMLNEHVDENLMMPTMKMLFKSNVRILWDFENGEYILKTAWKNVCTSILDLIANNM